MTTLAHVPSLRPAARLGLLAPLACALLATGGCATRVDLKRMTYEALRREDCRLNQLDQFCQRNFANEYADYERLRRHFLRDTLEASGGEAVTGEER